MKIQRPKGITQIPKYAQITHVGEIATEYTWSIKMPDGNIKTYRKLKRPDIVTLLPLTPDNKIIVVELSLPSGEKEYRLPEMEFSDENKVIENVFRLIKKAGLKNSEIELWEKSQPFDKKVTKVDEYIIANVDCAVYIFFINNVQIIDKPKLDYNVSYKLITLTIGHFIKKVKNLEIQNIHVQINTSKLKKFLL